MPRQRARPACNHREFTLTFYQNVTRQTLAHGGLRIFAPIAYSAVRETQIVPVVVIEALALASWFPICWHDDGAGPALVALRSVLTDGSHQPPGSPDSFNSLPLALKAYPFVVGQRSDDSAEQLIDDAVPDRPTDLGATIMKPDGKPGRGAEQRLRAAAAYDEAQPLTAAITDELVKADLLEPWPLAYETADGKATVDNLFVLRPVETLGPRLFGFVSKFGPDGASLIGAHRLSLFRAGVLVKTAQAASRASAPAPVDG